MIVCGSVLLCHSCVLSFMFVCVVIHVHVCCHSCSCVLSFMFVCNFTRMNSYEVQPIAFEVSFLHSYEFIRVKLRTNMNDNTHE